MYQAVLFPEQQIVVPKEEQLAAWSLPLGLQWVLEGMKEYETQKENPAFLELYRYLFHSKEYGEEIRWLLDAAFYSYEERGIGRTAAREIYGTILR